MCLRSYALPSEHCGVGRREREAEIEAEAKREVICEMPQETALFLPPFLQNDFRLVKHARYSLLPAEGHLHRRLFGDMLRRIWVLPVPDV